MQLPYSSPHPMDCYHDLMRRCIEEGVPVAHERTGEICHTLFGEQLKFDMRAGFPAVTTKKLAFKSMVGELLGILRGATSAAEFRALGSKVWDGNANETPSWLANPNRKGVDDLGRSYGSQWTDWTDMRVIPACELDDSWEVLSPVWRWRDGRCYVTVRRGIHQVEEALRTIFMSPSNRRIVINGWRPDEHDRTALPVCHMVYNFFANPATKTLDMVMHQRSWDVFLAFNIPMSALFLHLMARKAGYAPGKLTLQIANAHVYESHVEQVRVQLGREHLPQPRLVLSDRIQPVAGLDDVFGAFDEIEPDDIWLGGYQSHGPLKAKMAV